MKCRSSPDGGVPCTQWVHEPTTERKEYTHLRFRSIRNATSVSALPTDIVDEPSVPVADGSIGYTSTFVRTQFRSVQKIYWQKDNMFGIFA